MAQKVHIVLTDDIEKTIEADETVTFGLDGVTYEIDLAAKNAAALRDAIAPFKAEARRVSGGRGKPAARRERASGAGGNATEVRAWARDNGMPVNDRGRVPAEVRAAYEAAHS